MVMNYQLLLSLITVNHLAKPLKRNVLFSGNVLKFSFGRQFQLYATRDNGIKAQYAQNGNLGGDDVIPMLSKE